MTYRIAIQLFFFLLPFLAFGIYRLLVADAEADGRKAWPIHILFGAGAALSAGVWIYFVLSEDRTRDHCYEPSRFENGVLIPAKKVPCEQDVSRVGIPQDGPYPEPASGVGTDQPDASDEIAATPLEPVSPDRPVGEDDE